MRRVWGWAPFPGVSWKLRRCWILQSASHPCWNCARGTAPGSPCLEGKEALSGEAPHRRGSLAEKRGERNSSCPCARESCRVRGGSVEGRAALSPQQDPVPSLVARARPSPGAKDTPSAPSPQRGRGCPPRCAQPCPAPGILAAGRLSVCPRFPTWCFSSCSPFQPLLLFVPNPYFCIPSECCQLGPRRSLQHSSALCHGRPASSSRSPSPPTALPGLPCLINPCFPVLIRCCLPTQRKAGRCTALPRTARDVVYAQWWHLSRRCARVTPGQSS